MGNKTVIPNKNMNYCMKCIVTYTKSTEESAFSKDKMDCNLMKCAKCSDNYSEDRVPRSLGCGHSLCTPCAEKCLADQKICPECQEEQLAKKIEDLPVNFPLLRIIRSISSGEFDISYMIVTTFPADMFCSNQQKDIWKCGAHGNPLLFLCSTCSMWVCQDCLVVDHPRLPRGSCRILEHTDAMNRIKVEHKKIANQTQKEVENMKRTFEFEISMHDFCLKYCSKDNRSHSWLAQRVESQLEDLKKSSDSVVERVKERLRKSVDPVNPNTSPEEMATYCAELLNCQNNLKENIDEEKKKLRPVLLIMKEHLRMDLKVLAGGMEPVYAILDGGKASSWASISIRDNRLLLYCLREGRPPKEGITIPFEHVKKLIPKEGMTTFLEVATEEKVLGRVYVKLDEDNPLTEQFVLMCSGQKGLSYRNSCFYKYEDKEELLRGGDYENNDGTGGRPIITGLGGDCDTSDKHYKNAGCLVINKVSTRFHFNLRHKNEGIEETSGQIMAGLNVLKTLVKVEPVTKSVIRECGLVIPMKPDEEFEEEEDEEEDQEEEEE